MEPLRCVTEDDVRVSWSGQIVAAPMWAYEPSWWPGSGLRGRFTMIEACWEPYWTRPRPVATGWTAPNRDECIRIIADPESNPMARELAQVRLVAFKNSRPDPNRRAAPSLMYPSYAAIKTCRSCGVEFFGLGSTVTCTPACEEDRRKVTRTRGTPAPRTVVHEMMTCRWCQEGFTPRRRDAVFCSTTCRVAHHRLHRD